MAPLASPSSLVSHRLALTPAPSVLERTDAIAYPFGVKWPVHRRLVDPAHRAASAGPPSRVVHRTSPWLPRGAESAARVKPPVKATPVLQNSPSVSNESTRDPN